MTEITMELIEENPLRRRKRRLKYDGLRMDIGVLPCPSNFNEVFVAFEQP